MDDECAPINRLLSETENTAAEGLLGLSDAGGYETNPHTNLQTRNIQPMLVQCWASVEDDGPTLYQHWLNVLCLLGIHIILVFCLSSAELYFSIQMIYPSKGVHVWIMVFFK